MMKKLVWFLLVGIVACSGGKTIIRSDPPTAFVTINGVHKGVTPLEIKLDCEKTRKFVVEISSPGYLTQTKVLSCGRVLGMQKGIFIELQPGEEPEKREMPSGSFSSKEDFGTIKIKSLPAEAEVYLNDEFIGTTPFVKQKIKSGDYTLEVHKSGFKNWRQDVQIKSGSEQEYFPILEEE